MYQQTLKMTDSTLKFSDWLDNSVSYSKILSAFYKAKSCQPSRQISQKPISVTSVGQQTGLLYIIPLQKQNAAPLKKNAHIQFLHCVLGPC